MILFCIFILIPLITATPYDGPSYRSSVMEGDKPILRMLSDAGGYDSDDEDSDGLRKPIRVKKDPEMVEDLSMLIGWLMENFGYDLGPLQARRNKDDIFSQSFDHSKKALRDSSLYDNKKPRSFPKTPAKIPQATRDTSQSQTGDPSWKTDLKEFIKDLITRFGQNELNQFTKPVIKSLEKKHDVTITDIDGAILINHITKDKKPKPEPKALRYRTPEDDVEDKPLVTKK